MTVISSSFNATRLKASVHLASKDRWRYLRSMRTHEMLFFLSTSEGPSEDVTRVFPTGPNAWTVQDTRLAQMSLNTDWAYYGAAGRFLKVFFFVYLARPTIDRFTRTGTCDISFIMYTRRLPACRSRRAKSYTHGTAALPPTRARNENTSSPFSRAVRNMPRNAHGSVVLAFDRHSFVESSGA